MGPVFRGQCGVCLRVVRALPARSLVGGRGDPPGVCYLDPADARPDPASSGETSPKRLRPRRRAPADLDLQAGIAAFNLAESIRRFGHLAARLDPLGFHDPIGDPSLAPQSHGLTTDALKQLPASIVSGPAAAGAANAFDAIAQAATRSTARRPATTTTTCSCRTSACGCVRRSSPASSVRPTIRSTAPSCSIASRRSRRSSDSCIARSRARRAFRSRAST